MSEWMNKVLIWGANNRKGKDFFPAQSTIVGYLKAMHTRNFYYFHTMCSDWKESTAPPPPTPFEWKNESYTNGQRIGRTSLSTNADLGIKYSFTISGEKFSLIFSFLPQKHIIETYYSTVSVWHQPLKKVHWKILQNAVAQVWPTWGKAGIYMMMTDCFYITLFSALEQTHHTHMSFYMSD